MAAGKLNPKNGKLKESGGEGLAQEDLNRLINDSLQRNRIPNVFFEELELLNLMHLSEKSLTSSGFYNGFVVGCSTEEKRKEKERRMQTIIDTIGEIKDLKKKNPNYDENELNDLLRKINTEKAAFMTENKFFGYAGSSEQGFNYGREVLKGAFEEKMEVPYRRYDLYQFPDTLTSLGLGSKSTRENNFVYSGVKRGAILKGGIRLMSLEEEPTYHKLNNHKKFEFDIYLPSMLELFKSTCQIKVRFYLLRGLNLAAQSNATQIKYNLGGYSAMSSADPYPKIQVGDARNDVNAGVCKHISDVNSVDKKTLNPSFFKNYELDAFLPADWKLTLLIYNQGSMLYDSLIGEKEIDIEDRYFSDAFRMRTFALEERTKELQKEIKSLSQLGGNPEATIKKQEKEDELREMIQYLKPLTMNRPAQPIEYCFLTQSGISTMQGSAEILLESFSFAESAQFPVVKFEAPKPVKYQIRLIIWEAFDIPLGDKKAVDVLFKATLNNEGWSVDEVSKETDTHLGSDGYAIFNWRMLFDLQIPCAFPRLKISAFDFDAFGSNDSIGEVTLKFDNIVHKLKSEGRYEAPKKRIKLKNVKKGGEDAGEVAISFKIIQSSEAASVPVGEGQEEPNTDPFLEKPKIGRGIGDFFKKLSFKFNFSFGLLFMIFKYLSLAGAGLTIFAVLFIKPGLLT